MAGIQNKKMSEVADVNRSRTRLGLMAQQVWRSAALMTLFNTSAKVCSLGLILPFILNRFSEGDYALYQLLSLIITLQMLVGAGFVPTFARFIAHALAGMPEDQLGKLQVGTNEVQHHLEVDADLFSRIIGTLRRIFLVLSALSLPLVGLVGFFLLDKPVRESSTPANSWMAWGIVACVTPLTLYASQFSAILQGANKIAAEQRWSAIFTIAGTLLALSSLALGGTLLVLIAVNQLLQVVSFCRLYWLASHTLKTLPYASPDDRYCPKVFHAIWPNSWRSLTGVISAAGVMAASGLAFAQIMDSGPLAEFLLGLRIMQVVGEVSRAPFYSQLPILNRLRVKGEIDKLRSLVRRNMIRSHIGYIILFGVAPVASLVVLPLIHSKVAFPDMAFWIVLGLAAFVERWGAMHLQTYSTTNHIIWHWVNGYTGILWVSLMMVLAPVIGIYAYPIGLLAANCLIYSRVAARRSIASLGCTFWEFERRCSLPAFVVFFMCCGCLWLIRGLVYRTSL